MWRAFFTTSFLCLASISSINAATIYMRPEADTFVVDPPANPPLAILAGEQDSDFGGGVPAPSPRRRLSAERAGQAGHMAFSRACSASTARPWRATRFPTYRCNSLSL